MAASTPARRSGWHLTIWGELSAEFLGTFVLLAFGCGVVAMAVAALSQSGRGTESFVASGDWLLITWGWALAVTFAVYVAGSISGAHITPAVTLAFAVKRDFPWSKVLPYVAAHHPGETPNLAGGRSKDKPREKSLEKGRTEPSGSGGSPDRVATEPGIRSQARPYAATLAAALPGIGTATSRPALEIGIGRERYAPEQRFLTHREVSVELADYEERHPWASRVVPPLLGFWLDGSDATLGAFADSWRMGWPSVPDVSARRTRETVASVIGATGWRFSNRTARWAPKACAGPDLALPARTTLTKPLLEPRRTLTDPGNNPTSSRRDRF